MTGVPFYLLVGSQLIFLAMQVYFFLRGFRFYREGRRYRDTYRAALAALAAFVSATEAVNGRRVLRTRPPEEPHTRTPLDG